MRKHAISTTAVAEQSAPLPPCPPWCIVGDRRPLDATRPHDWEIDEVDGSATRYHDPCDTFTLELAGEQIAGDAVTFGIAAAENSVTGLQPATIDLEADAVHLRAGEARQVAAKLLEMADRLDDINRS